MSDASSSRRLAGERTDYLAGSLPDEAPADPLALFEIWLEEAFARREEHADPPDPSAVVLSTVALDAEGQLEPLPHVQCLEQVDLLLERDVGRVSGCVGERARLAGPPLHRVQHP